MYDDRKIMWRHNYIMHDPHTVLVCLGMGGSLRMLIDPTEGDRSLVMVVVPPAALGEPAEKGNVCTRMWSS